MTDDEKAALIRDTWRYNRYPWPKGRNILLLSPKRTTAIQPYELADQVNPHFDVVEFRIQLSFQGSKRVLRVVGSYQGVTLPVHYAPADPK